MFETICRLKGDFVTSRFLRRYLPKGTALLPVDGTTRVVGLEEETGGTLWWGTGPPGGGRGCRTTGVDARVHIMLLSKKLFLKFLQNK